MNIFGRSFGRQRESVLGHLDTEISDKETIDSDPDKKGDSKIEKETSYVSLPEVDEKDEEEIPYIEIDDNKESWELEDAIDEADSLKALGEVVANHNFYVDGKVYPRWQAMNVFMEAKNYLKENMDDIIAGTMNGGNNEYRNALGDRIRALNEIDPQLGEKTKELMKGLMEQWFEKRKNLLVDKSISDSLNLRELAIAVHQFKYIEEGDHRLDKEELDKALAESVEEIRELYKSKGISKDKMEEVLISHHVPKVHGIMKRAVDLLIKEINKDKLEAKSNSQRSSSSGSSSGSSDPSNGVKSGIFTRVRGWFSRK